MRWVECNEDADTLPYPCCINNSKMEIDGNMNGTVGEVFEARHPFVREKIPVGLSGPHVCGTEDDFNDGCKYDDTPPLVKYGAFGWPLCCDPPKRVRGGGGGGGKAAFNVYGGIDPTEGGLEIGGEAGDKIKYLNPALGGLEIGGEAGDKIKYLNTTFGGLLIGGEAGDVFTPAPDYCDYYENNTLGVIVSWTFTGGIEDQLWVEAIPATYLQSPIATGSVWRYTDPSGPTVWEAPATWNGQGTQTFTRVSGGGFLTVNVECFA